MKLLQSKFIALIFAMLSSTAATAQTYDILDWSYELGIYANHPHLEPLMFWGAYFAGIEAKGPESYRPIYSTSGPSNRIIILYPLMDKKYTYKVTNEYYSSNNLSYCYLGVGTKSVYTPGTDSYPANCGDACTSRWVSGMAAGFNRCHAKRNVNNYTFTGSF